MKSASGGKVTSGQSRAPSLPSNSGSSRGPGPMPRVGGHTTNNGNGKQGVPTGSGSGC